MKLTVAGAEKKYEEGLTIEQLLAKENVEMPLCVTVTMNDDFVQAGARRLKDGGQVEFLYFMGGGC